MYPLRRNQDAAPRLYYCFRTAPPLSLHPLPSLISNCLNLPFGTQGTQKGFCAQEPHRVLLSFTGAAMKDPQYILTTLEWTGTLSWLFSHPNCIKPPVPGPSEGCCIPSSRQSPQASTQPLPCTHGHLQWHLTAGSFILDGDLELPRFPIHFVLLTWNFSFD